MKSFVSLMLFLLSGLVVVYLICCLVTYAQADTCTVGPVRGFAPVRAPVYKTPTHSVPTHEVSYPPVYYPFPVDVFIYTGPPVAVSITSTTPSVSGGAGSSPTSASLATVPTPVSGTLSADALRVIREDAGSPGPVARGYLPGAIRSPPSSSSTTPSATSGVDLSSALRVSCVECHSAPRGKGGVTLFGLDGSLSPSVSWSVIRDVVASGSMPPPSRPRLTPDIIAEIGRMVR